jgi:hypothetical protein
LQTLREYAIEIGVVHPLVLREYAIEIGAVHPLVALVQQLLKDEWEAGANNMPGWHMEANQIKQLTKMLGDYL